MRRARTCTRDARRRRHVLDPRELERTIRIDPSEREGPPVQLVVLRGVERGRVFELRGLRAILGRGAANDLVLPSKAVSQMHAALHEADGEWYIQDLDSTNGTTVAGARLPPREPRPLRHGDAIGLGDQLLLFFRQERPLADLSELLDIDVDTDRVRAEVDALLRDLPGGGASR